MRSDEATLIAEWKRESGQGGRSSFQRLSALACRWKNSRVKLKPTLCSWAQKCNRWGRLLREASWRGEGLGRRERCSLPADKYLPCSWRQRRTCRFIMETWARLCRRPKRRIGKRVGEEPYVVPTVVLSVFSAVIHRWLSYDAAESCDGI